MQDSEQQISATELVAPAETVMRPSLAAPFSRRMVIGAGAAAGVGLAAHVAQAQSLKATKAGDADGSASNPGPENKGLSSMNPDSVMPPPTDHGSVPQCWQSFSLSHRRIQDGGWARQVNQTDFPISTTMAGVNMKLNAGGIRELHWHEANEWALMLTGSARITSLGYNGDPFVEDVKAGDLWYFPEGLPHSIQGLGPDGCEFLLVFDQGKFDEDDTTLLTDWVSHTPREVLAKNFGVSAKELDPIDQLPPGGRWIFPAPVPPPLQHDVAAATKNDPMSKLGFSFAMLEMKPTKEDASGTIRIVDSRTFKLSKTIAMAHVVVKPGAMREMHWHTNADEWQYYIAGEGRMTVFANKSDARTMDFRPGDVGYIPVTLPHYIENTGSEDLVFLEMFKSDKYDDVSLNEWLASLPPELVQVHLSLPESTLAMFPKKNTGIVPSEA